mgnify:CR=1 FL=1
MRILFNLTKKELEEFVISIGEEKFRANQIYNWLNIGAHKFEYMKNLPINLINKLETNSKPFPINIVKELNSSDLQTTKFLLELEEDERNNKVQIEYEPGTIKYVKEKLKELEKKVERINRITVVIEVSKKSDSEFFKDNIDTLNKLLTVINLKYNNKEVLENNVEKVLGEYDEKNKIKKNKRQNNFCKYSKSSFYLVYNYLRNDYIFNS